jgi:hypothetical protein
VELIPQIFGLLQASPARRIAVNIARLCVPRNRTRCFSIIRAATVFNSEQTVHSLFATLLPPFWKFLCQLRTVVSCPTPRNIPEDFIVFGFSHTYEPAEGPCSPHCRLTGTYALEELRALVLWKKLAQTSPHRKCAFCRINMFGTEEQGQLECPELPGCN